MQFSSLPYKAFIKLVFTHVCLSSFHYNSSAKIFRLIFIIYIFKIKRRKIKLIFDCAL